MAVEYVKLTGTLPNPAEGQAVTGKAVFTASDWLPDPTDGLLFPPAPGTVKIVSGQQWTIDLLATDNEDLPDGWTWSVEITIDGILRPRKFSFFLNFNDGAEQDIADLAPVEPTSSMAAYLLLGGGTMTGPLILAGEPGEPLEAATKQYVDEHGTGDKTFTQAFSDATTVAVEHNLSKYPAVTVIDSANDLVLCDTQYADLNNLTVTFSAPFSGTVICN